ncbi:MAG: D-glycerate dehydrogenase [Ignavibacteriota bacterium]|nr:MAG: D-glycerate dehydrogenase [Chlorobiota bacterium]MBE7477334.1 D-glycerate dehydrogenase [Ignavibacteriales bacterium]MBL1122734.1 D-glycerate dehydrogenase [Ignavibacteriota bacterium]MCC7095262.1 D-glycerate dehydrogenase [Ignavibacteriaceae bacterium]MCE7856782.1 D-glycerate dehydrogenase [Ignavibacteria bacterium CHB3]MEB2295555.1 D-glycerate dehydrogenase [Ignavibacteria bacterium]
MKVFITRKIPEIAFKLLKRNKIPFDYYKSDEPIPRELLLRKVKNCEGVISLLTEKIDKEVIDSMPECRIIANYAVGYNNIDIDYAKKKKIIVTNTPDVLTDSTADLTMALILACARRLSEGEKMLMSGNYKGWKPELLLGMELKDKIFGIIGAGRIGSAVARRAKSFGTKIIYVDNNRNLILEKETGAKKVQLKFLLKNSDILSLHLPLNEKTFHFLNQAKLNQLKQKSIIINTTRGEIIDESALIKLLKRNKLFAVGLDVFENEPEINPELLKFSNVLIIPHLGSATHEARNGISELAAQNIINVIKGKPPITPVFNYKLV